MLGRPPRVFVSYSHESPAHKAAVLGLAERLRADGVEAELDQYVAGSPPQGWPRWMLDRLDAADFVVLVCTATYYRRFRGHEAPGLGRGVDWEGLLITQALYDARGATTRMVPVLLDAVDEAFVPEPLRGQMSYLVTREDRYRALCELLHGRAGVVPRPVGGGAVSRDVPTGRARDQVCAPAVAAFVGPTERGPLRPVRIDGLDAYRRHFGEPLDVEATFLGAALRGFFANGGTAAWIVRACSPYACKAGVMDSGALRITAASPGWWGNRISVTIAPGSRAGHRVTIVCAPAEDGGAVEREDYDNASLDDRGPNPLFERVARDGRLIELDWFGHDPPALDALYGHWQLSGGVDGAWFAIDRTAALAALDALDDVDLVCVPDHVHPRLSQAEQSQLTDALIARGADRGFVLLATPPGEHAPGELQPRHDVAHAALYYPWLRAGGALVPPIGHVAGAFARSDAARGRHRAPIDLTLAGLDAPALEREVTADARDALLRVGVNPIDAGATLTTAITVAIDEHSRGVHVVRFGDLLRRALTRGLAWTVFERNDAALDARLVAEVEGFLRPLWEDGVLFGATAGEAFAVRCDDTTTTADDRANGRVHVVVLAAIDGASIMLHVTATVASDAPAGADGQHPS